MKALAWLGSADVDLVQCFGGIFSSETVAQYLDISCQRIAKTPRTTSYLRVLAERFAQEQITTLAQT